MQCWLCVCVCVCVLVSQSCLTVCDLWNAAHQATLSIGFSRQEYWSGLLFPPPGDLPNPGIKSRSLVLQMDSLPSESWRRRLPYMILYIENPKDFTKNMRTNTLSKVVEWKIYIQKSVAFLCTNNKLPGGETEKTIWCTFAWKWIKYLGINLTKEVKDLYTENYKHIDERYWRWLK